MTTVERSCRVAAWAAYLLLLAWLGDLGGAWSEWRKDEKLAAWVQAFGAIAAIGAAIGIMNWQHRRDVQRAADDRTTGEVDLVNGLIVVLMQQFDMLLKVKAQLLDSVRQSPTRHFEMGSTEHYDMRHWLFDTSRLSFLVAHDKKDCLMAMVLAHNAFHSAIRSLNARTDFHKAEWLPRLETLGRSPPEDKLRPAALEALAGPRVALTLRGTTDALYLNVDDALRHLLVAGQTTASELRDLYPGRRIIGFNAPRL